MVGRRCWFKISLAKSERSFTSGNVSPQAGLLQEIRLTRSSLSLHRSRIMISHKNMKAILIAALLGLSTAQSTIDPYAIDPSEFSPDARGKNPLPHLLRQPLTQRSRCNVQYPTTHVQTSLRHRNQHQPLQLRTLQTPPPGTFFNSTPLTPSVPRTPSNSTAPAQRTAPRRAWNTTRTRCRP